MCSPGTGKIITWTKEYKDIPSHTNYGALADLVANAHHHIPPEIISLHHPRTGIILSDRAIVGTCHTDGDVILSRIHYKRDGILIYRVLRDKWSAVRSCYLKLGDTFFERVYISAAEDHWIKMVVAVDDAMIVSPFDRSCGFLTAIRPEWVY